MDKEIRKIILTEGAPNTIPFEFVDEKKSIFAYRDDRLVGMVVKEKAGWITRIGGPSGANGFYDKLKDCLDEGGAYGYEYRTCGY